jgi:hypothetical protein
VPCQPSEHRQVGVEADALDAADAQHGEAVGVLQASELTLDANLPRRAIRASAC